MDRGDMASLVERVADSFETERNAEVTQDARQQLVDPAVPHLDFVTKEIAAGNITEAFLESSARIILENAYRFAQSINGGKRTIKVSDVNDSMKRYCPYLFWG